MHALRPFQIEAYDSLVKYDHTILIAPTGSGKSLIFQTYLLNFKEHTRAVFISPLNALARQHEESFRKLGLTVHQGVGFRGQSAPNGSGIWILNPEQVFGKFKSEVEAWRPNLLVVDEAHCVWEWGNTFRKRFSELPHLIKDLKIAKSFWCTATLPLPALEQLQASLPAHSHVLGRFSLPSSLQVLKLKVPPHSRLEVLRSLLQSDVSKSGMIFVSTRKTSDRLLQYLRFWKIEAVSYHAGLSSEERLALEKRISAAATEEKSFWIVATSAFGMGMNYPFLKTCILFEPSFNLLSLAQALGRVGRNADLCQAYVLWHENDFIRHSWLSQSSKSNHQRYQQVQGWCETQSCPRNHLEKYFNGSEISGKVEI